MVGIGSGQRIGRRAKGAEAAIGWVVGFAAGIALQKIYGVGTVLRRLSALVSVQPRATIDRGPPLPVGDLPARRMIALVLGQSNAANHGETRHAPDGRVYVLC